jgi:hypothetical protein
MFHNGCKIKEKISTKKCLYEKRLVCETTSEYVRKNVVRERRRSMMSSKRTVIRLGVLADLHRVLDEGKKRMMISVNVETEDPEKFFALEYLAEKKYVYFKQTSPDHYIAKITPLGKSYLEATVRPKAVTPSVPVTVAK